MATFEDIKKANELIKTVNIKGKEYAEVSQRIKAFRSVYPNGQITTEMVSNDSGVCIMRSMVIDDEGKLLGTGYAYEKEQSSYINNTSYIENCETSAVGRALGMCGFGIDTAVASAEEVKEAQAQKDAIVKKEVAEDKAKTEEVNNALVEERDVRALKSGLEKNGIPIEFILKAYKISDLSQLKFEQYNALRKKDGMEKAKKAYLESCEEK